MADLGADPSLGDLSRAELGELLEGEPAYRLDQVWEGLYRQRRPLTEITNVPKSLRRAISELLPPALTLVRTQSADRGTTTKHLWSLRDGHLVESVLMRYRDRTTLCISSQAGCAMACSFCATGQVGFDRNLSVGEIVEQVLGTLQEAPSGPNAAARGGAVNSAAARGGAVNSAAARGGAVNSAAARGGAVNIVFMGMGEPLANYESVWAAVERFHTDMGIGARHITVSTVGVIPGIERMAKARLPVNLAVSLHAANDRLRNRIAPINRTYPLRDLARALADYRRAKRRRISLEWAMIGGVNDTDRDAAELAAYTRPLAAHVNLIPLNPTPGYSHEPSPAERIEHFAAELSSLGVNATVRRNRGTSIDAACGQLRADKLVSIRKGSARARAER
ncbi:23S rRNA (adenine(2503)-C(2))-methyltransferase RlmN [Candidatus Poriferisodalis sp.]|uniref:23S rRNA (adenine(2503)-C(2))-methyltransferase RlmN n=1 Tax=Candidatus Poriferisodalis sp. TaxID=3101277 RepID=UPI003B026ECE